MPWAIILGGLALAVALVLAALLIVRAIRSARRRDGDESAVAAAAESPAKAAILEQTHVATARDRDHVTLRRSATRIHANGHRAEGAAATEGDRTEIQSARSQGDDLPEPAEAAGASNPGVLPEVQGNGVDAQAANGRADERGHGTAASNLGRLLEEQGGPAEAEAAYVRADKRRGNGVTGLDVPPEEPGAPDEAEAAYRRAVEQGAAAASFNLGVLLEERGDLAAAEYAYRRAEEHGDEDVANLARAALLHLVRGVEAVGAGSAAGAHRG
jgi:tetratricopeptide (TPR) repeat protein